TIAQGSPVTTDESLRRVEEKRVDILQRCFTMAILYKSWHISCRIYYVFTVAVDREMSCPQLIDLLNLIIIKTGRPFTFNFYILFNPIETSRNIFDSLCIFEIQLDLNISDINPAMPDAINNLATLDRQHAGQHVIPAEHTVEYSGPF